ncbi:MAG: AAA family ATPase [Candidatus Dormibacteraeota bacterium]|nr:AAA family ATPase [Candidatus Dormibacteraeota bacterium]
MVCPNCQAENRPGRKFCAQCGTALAAACPSCGAANQPGERFCGECGTALTGAPASHAAAGQAAVPPAAERRLVSVLFADLVGFTSLSDTRDPEDVRDLLTRYFETSREVVGRYGGTVDKFIGDAVVAVWGTPTAHEDDAERAVRAGFDLTDAVAALGKQMNGTPLALRAAVGSGQAAVVIGAAGQGMVAGDLVNTASRLQAAALPGGLLVDERTYQATSRSILFEPIGEQNLKGKALPVPAWRALRVVAARRGGGRSERLEPPFTGRDEELRLLKELFHATAREKRVRLISIVGQAGIGKSRLVWEFQKYLDGFVQDIYWHQGRSPAYGEGVTFWALGEMLRRRARIAETDDVETTRQKLEAAVAENVPDESERRWLTPHLAALLGIEDAPPGQNEQAFAAWRAFFERVAQRGPTVMVFEDLHWADQGLFDFIEHMLRWSRQFPILIVTLARPELRERRPTWGVDQRNYTGLHLEPLTTDAMAQLLEGLVPGLPGAVSQQIVTRAEGVPLYAVEIVRMLLDDGRLIAEQGRYRIAGKIDGFDVPATLHALVNARLDALPADERALLQDAAVLGQRFTLEGLGALRSQTAETLKPKLNALVRRELLVFDADPRSPERGQFGFTQGVIREIAYATLPKRDRRTRHERVAVYLEGLADPEFAGIIASHYLAAYQATSAGPEADALKAKARASVHDAALRAAALHSHGQALAYLEQALAITDNELQQLELWRLAAISAEANAQGAIAESYLQRVIDRCRNRDDHTGAADAMATVARLANYAGQPQRAIQILEQARAEIQEHDTGGATARITAELSRSYLLHGEARRALEWAEKALQAAGPLDLLPVIADALITKGTALADVDGRFREGQAELWGALAVAQAHGLTGSEFRARNNLATLYLLDDSRVQLAVARDGLELMRKLGQRGWTMGLADQSSSAAIETGEWDWALGVIAEFDQDDLTTSTRINLVVNRAVINGWRGDLEADAETLATVEPVIAGWTDPQWAALSTYCGLHRALAAGDPERAYRAAMRGLEVAPDDVLITTYHSAFAARAALWMKDRARMADALSKVDATQVRGGWVDTMRQTLHAGLLALEGRTDEAVQGYVAAARRWRELETWFELALSQFDFATTIGTNHPEAKAAAEEARQIFTRLAAKPMLQRLEDIALESP